MTDYDYNYAKSIIDNWKQYEDGIDFCRAQMRALEMQIKSIDEVDWYKGDKGKLKDNLYNVKHVYLNRKLNLEDAQREALDDARAYTGWEIDSIRELRQRVFKYSGLRETLMSIATSVKGYTEVLEILTGQKELTKPCYWILSIPGTTDQEKTDHVNKRLEQLERRFNETLEQMFNI